MSRPSWLALRAAASASQGGPEAGRAVRAEGLEAVGTALGEASTSDEEGGEAFVLGVCRVEPPAPGRRPSHNERDSVTRGEQWAHRGPRRLLLCGR